MLGISVFAEFNISEVKHFFYFALGETGVLSYFPGPELISAEVMDFRRVDI